MLELPNFGMKSLTGLDLLRQNMMRCMAQNIPKWLRLTKAHEPLYIATHVALLACTDQVTLLNLIWVITMTQTLQFFYFKHFKRAKFCLFSSFFYIYRLSERKTEYISQLIWEKGLTVVFHKVVYPVYNATL